MFLDHKTLTEERTGTNVSPASEEGLIETEALRETQQPLRYVEYCPLTFLTTED